MKIHEYQAKELFLQAGMPVPSGEIATNVADAVSIAESIGRPVMVKAQVHVGGRGKAGGVKYAENVEAVRVWAQKILGMDIKGLTVKKVLITEEMVGHKLGEFALTRTYRGHTSKVGKDKGRK